MFDIFCFMAAGMVVLTVAVLEKAVGPDVDLSDVLEITPFQDKAVVIASTIFLAVRIVWFLYDKLIVDRKERKAKKIREEKLLKHLDLKYGEPKNNHSEKKDY